MRNLQAIQTHFQQFLLHEPSTIQDCILPTENISITKRLEIYQDAYYLRLIDALQQDYPVLYAMTGSDNFNQLAYHYISVYPSRFRSIRWFGSELKNFLQHIPSYAEQPWLIEMAEFEWLLTETFDANDRVAVTVAEMASIPAEKWPEVFFKLHPSLRKLTLHWNMVPIWKAQTEEGILLPPQRANIHVPWIIWRKDFNIQF